MMENQNDVKKRPAVLAEYGLHADWVVRPLVEAGFEVEVCPFVELADRLASGRHNVVVLGRYFIPRQTRQGEIRVMDRLTAALDVFVKRGGGVYLTLPVDEQMPYHRLFEHFGVSALPLKIVQDQDGHEDHGRFLYTSAVDPVLGANVRGVWFPAVMGGGLAAATRPLRATGAGWKTVLAAAAASRTEKLEIVGYGLPGEDIAGYDRAVPVMALRDGLPGRLAVCGVPGGYYLFSPNQFPLLQHLLRTGFSDRHSDWLPLFINTLRWLAEPSCQSGALGGATTNPQALLPQVPRFPDDPPVRWATRPFPPDPRPIQGLIGARTAYSSGSGTVADYVAKAKAAGHDFIVFLEDFAHLDAAQFEALRADCEAHTTDTFLAVPGYTVVDIVGSRYFQYGYTIQLPREDLLAADGKTLTSKPGNNPRTSRIESVHLSLLFGELNMRGRRGTFRHADSPKSLLQNRATDSIALVTWEDGRIIEDVRDQYPMLVDKGLRLNPTVLTFLNTPGDFDRAVATGWRNMIIEPYAAQRAQVFRKHMAPELEWWGFFDEEVISSPRYRFDCWQYGHPFQSISSGPVVRAWTMSVSERDPAWGAPDHEIPPTADWFRADVLHLRLRIHVTAEKGLREVLLRDGSALLRRWQCDGAPSFELELDLLHDQQRQLQLEAHDTQGGVALTSDYACLRRDWCEFYCADRNNPLAIGYEKDENGLAYGWSGNTFLTYNSMQWGGTSPYLGKWWYTGDSMHPVPADPARDTTAPTDGGVHPPGAGVHIKLELPDLQPPERGLMINTGQELISTDVAISGFLCDHGYDPAAPYFFGGEHGFGLYGMYPTRYVDVRRRAMAFRPLPHQLTTVVYQYDLRFKRQPDLREPLYVGWIDAANHEFLRQDGGRLKVPELPGEIIRWQRGDALVAWHAGARPAIFINDGADLLLSREARDGREFGLRLPLECCPPPGATTRLRLIGLGGTHAHRDRGLFAHLQRTMGFIGTPAYAVEMELGALRSQRLLLELDANGGAGVALTMPRVELPAALPILIHNLRANWPVVFIDRVARRWRPLGQLEGTAYATLDTAAQDWRIFLGHPVVALHPEVTLSLVPVGETAWRLEIHNPTATLIETRVTPAPFFDLLAWDGATVTLPPGRSTVLELHPRQNAT